MTLVPAESSPYLFPQDLSSLANLISNELPLPSDEIDESWAIPNSKKEGYSSVYINKYCVKNNNSRPFKDFHPTIKTLADLHTVSFKAHAQNDCLGVRKFHPKTGKYDNFYSFESFAQTEIRQKNLGAGILKVLSENKFRTPEIDIKDFILSLYSCNKHEWVLCDIMCQFYKIANTCLYDTLGPDTSAYILKLTNSPVVVCTKDKLGILLKIKKEQQITNLITVITMEDLQDSDEHYYSLFDEAGMELYDFKTIEQIGEENPTPYRRAQPDDLYTISFTSGTTGLPKGVMISQAMALTGVLFSVATLRQPEPVRNQVYALSFLPLAHIYERQSYLSHFTNGTGIGFLHDGLATSLVENLQILKPDFLVCVPRVYSKLEAAIKDKIHQPGLAPTLARNAIATKMEAMASKDGEKGSLFLRDRVIINKLKKALGFDNVQYLVSGSAPISVETLRFCKAAFNCGFVQGYGLTESFAGCSVSAMHEAQPGSCGPMGICAEFKLRDIPEMNYYSEHPEYPKGELLLRGPIIFNGYYKNEKATKEAIDEDGWFHTGDVASIDKRGRINIVDRVKNFFKLSQGEYITPERIENIYLSQSPVLSQLYVHGDSLQSYLVAIAGVDVARLRKFIAHHEPKLSKLNDGELLRCVNKNLTLKAQLLKELNHHVRREGLQGYEKFRNIYIDVEPLKVENEVITPTMKIKRNIARKFFTKEIEELYKEGDLIKKQGVKL